MYQLIAEQKDETGKTLLTHKVIAESFKPFLRHTQSRDVLTHTVGGVELPMIVGPEEQDGDYQFVTVLDATGKILGLVAHNPATRSVELVGEAIAGVRAV